MEITRADAPSEVLIDLQFIKPFKASWVVTFALAPQGDGTRVVWTIVGEKTFGVKLMGLFRSMDKMIGPDLEKGLTQLKQVSEGATSG